MVRIPLLINFFPLEKCKLLIKIDLSIMLTIIFILHVNDALVPLREILLQHMKPCKINYLFGGVLIYYINMRQKHKIGKYY